MRQSQLGRQASRPARLSFDLRLYLLDDLIHHQPIGPEGRSSPRVDWESVQSDGTGQLGGSWGFDCNILRRELSAAPQSRRFDFHLVSDHLFLIHVAIRGVASLLLRSGSRAPVAPSLGLHERLDPIAPIFVPMSWHDTLPKDYSPSR
jgi:hypothetical protein